MSKVKNSSTGVIHLASLDPLGMGYDYTTRCGIEVNASHDTSRPYYQVAADSLVTCKRCLAIMRESEIDHIEIGMAEKDENAETGFLLRIQENVEVSRVPIVHDVYVRTNNVEEAIVKGCDRITAGRADVLSVRRVQTIQEFERVETVKFEPVE